MRDSHLLQLELKNNLTVGWTSFALFLQSAADTLSGPSTSLPLTATFLAVIEDRAPDRLTMLGSAAGADLGEIAF